MSYTNTHTNKHTTIPNMNIVLQKSYIIVEDLPRHHDNNQFKPHMRTQQTQTHTLRHTNTGFRINYMNYIYIYMRQVWCCFMKMQSKHSPPGHRQPQNSTYPQPRRRPQPTRIEHIQSAQSVLHSVLFQRLPHIYVYDMRMYSKTLITNRNFIHCGCVRRTRCRRRRRIWRRSCRFRRRLTR